MYIATLQCTGGDLEPGMMYFRIFSYYMRSYLESQTPQNHRVVNTVTSSLNRSFLTHYVLADVGFLASVPMKHDAPRELTYLYLGKK